ncbi:MAG: aspartate carbamoyltransferase [Candidatus Parcubacteria bacterium]|nr:aspartate carbamoyltransferase [Candidatus Parcubacteria bacterium]
MVKYWGKDNVVWQDKMVEIDFPHVIHAQQFSLDDLEKLFMLTAILKQQIGKGKKKDWLNGNIVLNLIYEPSTRTMTSFSVAGLRLGADVITPADPAKLSSVIKGETLEDSIRIYADKVDVIILRHKDDDSALRASRSRFCQGVPIINAGAGKGQHPTQSLLDYFTIRERFGRIEGLIVAICGDLKHGRTSRSLAYLLSKYKGVEIYFVAPQVAQMSPDVLDYLTSHNVKWHQSETLKEVISFVDVCYMTRFQTEREDPEEKEIMAHASMVNVIDEQLAESMKDDAIIMHPLPRIHEIKWGVDKNKRSVYFLQALNGDYIRMALLLCILNPDKVEKLLASAA